MVFDKDFFKQHQSKLLFLLNNRFTKRWFRYVLRIRKEDLPLKTKILELGNNFFTHSAKRKGDKVELKTSFRSNEKYARRLWFAFEPLWWVLHAWDMVTKPWPALNLSFDTLPTKYSTPGSTVSGYCQRTGQDATYSTLRAGAGTVSGENGIITYNNSSATSNQFERISRSIFLFDTSALTSSATVTAAVVGLWGKGQFTGLGAFEIDVVASTPASDTVLANADFSQLGDTPFSSIASGSLSVNDTAYNLFTLDANGRANVSKTANSKFGIRNNWDTDNNFAGTWANGNLSGTSFQDSSYTGTTRDPKIDITYTLPAVATAGFLFNMI